MLDIDRNINSLVYEITSGDYINDLSSTTIDNFVVVHSITAKNVGSWKITLDPGEYYFKHILYPVESDNYMIFTEIFSSKFSFPIHNYYAQSALTGSSAFNVIIPWHFVINKQITFNISINKTTNATIKLDSLIEINRKVK